MSIRFLLTCFPGRGDGYLRSPPSRQCYNVPKFPSLGPNSVRRPTHGHLVPLPTVLNFETWHFHLLTPDSFVLLFPH